MPSLLAIVCPNGLGHYRRTMGILSRVKERVPHVELAVACEGWQRDRMGDWPRSIEVWRSARHLAGVVDGSIMWSDDPTTYDDDRLVRWEERLARVDVVADATLILSDNLTGVLGVRPDAWLAGSFLWSDVLGAAHPGSRPVQAFVERERALLSANRPKMLCVGPAAMPAVRERCDALECSWMCESPKESVTTERDRIGILGGATAAARTVLDTAVTMLLERGIEPILPEREIQRLGLEGRVASFDYSDAAWASLAAAVIRPGMGTIQDCLAHGIPMVALHEVNNVEMSHLGGVIEREGFGRYLRELTAEGLVEAVEGICAEARDLSSRILAAPRQGLDEAAAHIVRELEARA